MNIISLGAGVQSSTMALMEKHGEITPMPDCAIFADTQESRKPIESFFLKPKEIDLFDGNFNNECEGHCGV